MRKTRILIANDASWLGTGYGVYGKELLTRLQKTDRYEIAEIACYTKPEEIVERQKEVQWKLYAGVPSDATPEEARKQYTSDNRSAFGAWAFGPALLDFKPDIVFDMRDYWMYSFQEVHQFRDFYKWVVMPTVDSAPQKPEWLITFENMDLVIPYTDWAKKTLSDQCGDRINLFPKIANAGVDLDIFKPLSPEEKKKQKEQIFGNPDLHITGCVMRNQKRKLLPNIVKAYRQYLNQLLVEGKTEEYEKSFLYLHTTWPERSGWDIPSLLLEHNMLYKTYVTSLCSKCRKCFATKFHEQNLMCTECNEYTLITPNPSVSLDTDSLVKVYQIFDLFLQVAICEGFGMPQVEAAACGVPIASVDYSAMTEIVKKLEGYPIMVDTLFRELETGADRAYPVDEDIAGIIYDHFQLPEEEREKKSSRTRSLCEQHYSWDRVAEIWDEALSSVDISDKLDWCSPKREIAKIKVPRNLDEYELARFITTKIIGSPKMLQTSPLQSMLRLHVAQTGVDTRSIVQYFEAFINGRIKAEDKRIEKCQK